MSYDTPLEQKIALQSFTDSLAKEQGSVDKANEELAQAKDTLAAAQTRYDTLKALIHRLERDSQVGSATNATAHPSEPAARKQTPSAGSPRGEFREELIAIIKAGGDIKETGDIITSIRLSRGTVAKSSVVGALGHLFETGVLNRSRNIKPGTSYYGMPEWFDGDNPKSEHTPVHLLSRIPGI